MSDEDVLIQEQHEAGPGAFPDANAVRQLVDRVVAEARASDVTPTFVLMIVGGIAESGKLSARPGSAAGMIAVQGKGERDVAALRSIKLVTIVGESARILKAVKAGRA